MPTLTGKKCINFLMKPMNITKLKNIYIVFLARNPFSFLLDSPLRSCGLGTATTPSRSRLGIVAALESHAAGLSTFPLRPTCFHATSCTSAMMELMPCALTPAYGVTSICRFFQAVTALSIVPTVNRSSPLLSLGLLAVLFGLLSF